MNELLGKLTNLSYEFFGVLLPGAFINLFLAFWWVSLGDIPTYLSDGQLPSFSLAGLMSFIGGIFTDGKVGLIVPLLFIWYLLGHIALWFSRTGTAPIGSAQHSLRRIYLSLLLAPPRSKGNYDAHLQDIFELASKKLSLNGELLQWKQFFPIAKNVIARKSTYSLISTYQNKYTFHRSITIASAILFWLTLCGGLLAFVLSSGVGPSPIWWLQGVLLGAALMMVWGFSDSYDFHWKMFGNSIVTEAYSNLYFPDEKNGDENGTSGSD